MALIFVSVATFGQALEKHLTRTEEFSRKAGSIIEKDFKTFVTFKKIDIQIVTYRDYKAGDSAVFVRLEYYYKSSNTYLNENKAAVIEKEELPDLIKAANEMEARFFKNVYNNYIEFEYKCDSGLMIGAFVDTANSNVMRRFVKLESSSNSSVFFTGPEFREFIGYLEKINNTINK